MIQPRQMLVSSSKYSIKCPREMNAEFITVHNTANDASANNEVSYMIGNNSEVSFHFAIDDAEVVQGIPTNRNSWNAGDGYYGDGNRKSISIEICYSKSGGDKYIKAEALAIKFIAQLLKERSWGIDRVRTHKSWTEIGLAKGYSKYVKNCPHRILDEGRWQQFLNAIQIELNPPKPTLTYKSHVQGKGWLPEVSNNEIAGTTGQSLRMEALVVNLEGINIQAHVQSIGWQNPVTNGQVAGTEGKSLRMEAVRLWLTGELAKTHDILYRVHVQGKGWLPWVKNDTDYAGTVGKSLRMEAIQIKLVNKF